MGPFGFSFGVGIRPRRASVIAPVVQLVNPRIAVIGPSTDENNMYGVSGVFRSGPAASGPLMWALMKDRRATILEFTSTASPYVGGDIKAAGGAVLADLPAQVTAAIARKNQTPGSPWIASINFGRNDLQDGKVLADYVAAAPGLIASLRAAAFTYILLSLLSYKPAAYGGGWVVGGAYRQQVDLINAWLVATFGGASDIRIIDMQTALIDPATLATTKEPYALTHRSDATHVTNQGGERAGEPYLTALREICAPRAYPTAGLTIPTFAAGGPAMTGSGSSGSVVAGWTAATNTAGVNVAGSQVTIDGKLFQRFTVTNATGAPANGVNLTFSKTVPVPVAAGVRAGLRARMKLSATLQKYGVFAIFGNSANQGDTAVPASRAGLIAGVSDATATTAVGGAGAGFATPPGFLPTAKDLWLETASFVTGASGGSNVAVDIVFILGPGQAGDTFTIDIGEVQDFLYPIQV